MRESTREPQHASGETRERSEGMLCMMRESQGGRRDGEERDTSLFLLSS